MSRTSYGHACNKPTHGSCSRHKVSTPVIHVVTILPCPCICIMCPIHRPTYNCYKNELSLSLPENRKSPCVFFRAHGEVIVRCVLFSATRRIQPSPCAFFLAHGEVIVRRAFFLGTRQCNNFFLCVWRPSVPGPDLKIPRAILVPDPILNSPPRVTSKGSYVWCIYGMIRKPHARPDSNPHNRARAHGGSQMFIFHFFRLVRLVLVTPTGTKRANNLVPTRQYWSARPVLEVVSHAGTIYIK